MRLLKIFPVLLLSGLAYAASASIEGDKVIINDNSLHNSEIIYTGEHDIVSIFVPWDDSTFDEDTDSDEDFNSDEDTYGDEDDDITVFFVEADIHWTGQRTDRGLYALKRRNVTKLLTNGRDATAANDGTKDVYFGASDGLYKYNHLENKAEKYGPLTDSIVSLAKKNGADVIYILTNDYEVFKVSHKGKKKTKVEAIAYAAEIALDISNNLYFLGNDGYPYVLTSNGGRKIEGLPGNHTYAKLIKPPFTLEDGVFFIANDQTYTIYGNGTSKLNRFVFQVKPTAYSMENTVNHFYAYDKKIYKLNFLTLLPVLADQLSVLLKNIAHILTKFNNT